ncbi:hypothetical protein [Paraburkholderia humisilvae]|uniref:Uncharacterized protein n=1 Tax=Paraburkholderia humisilvae TaxID=627669 RepID=A0A6J5F6E0_9BURK|nr:hypothetical protein [Paraburkholderia humisilvae]CAB3774428.1 hypothetical protein LMG29542_07805 [Paraburkholderia humisilvae]
MSNNGFRVQGSFENFVQVSRLERQSPGAYAGDKFHLSVRRDLVPAAFSMLAELLLSESSPIDRWKATDLTKLEKQKGRLVDGAQWTMYVHTDAADSTYSAQGPQKVRGFVELSAHGIESGEHPDSDVRMIAGNMQVTAMSISVLERVTGPNGMNRAASHSTERWPNNHQRFDPGG